MSEDRAETVRGYGEPWHLGTAEVDPGEDAWDGLIWSPPSAAEIDEAKLRQCDPEPYEVAMVNDKEYAERIVACINACTTVPTATLASLNVAELLRQREAIRQLTVDIRRYILHHGVLIGECVAWNNLKGLVGVGQDHDCPSEQKGGAS